LIFFFISAPPRGLCFQEKVKAIQAHPKLATVKHFQAFPGVVSFNRHFVRGSIKIRCGSAEQEANTTHVGFYIILCWDISAHLYDA
jgi:hypothetical protein